MPYSDELLGYVNNDCKCMADWPNTLWAALCVWKCDIDNLYDRFPKVCSDFNYPFRQGGSFEILVGC